MPDTANHEPVKSVDFELSINRDQYLQYYRGDIKWVLATTKDGLKVRFPANLLIPYVTHSGINGSFRLHYLASGKAVSLLRKPC